MIWKESFLGDPRTFVSELARGKRDSNQRELAPGLAEPGGPYKFDCPRVCASGTMRRGWVPLDSEEKCKGLGNCFGSVTYNLRL